VSDLALAPLPDELVAALRGEVVAWADVGLRVERVLELCAAHEIGPLLYRRLRAQPSCDWPAAVIERLAQDARGEAAAEAVRQVELVSTLDGLAAAGVHPILLKGTPLAYTVYEIPSARRRCDTDLLVPRAQIDAARAALHACGYRPPVYCDGELVFQQFEMCKIDRLGIDHTLDVHWNVSMQTIFAELLTYDELAAHAMPVPALGVHARTAGPLHALLLACVHPAMHHRNETRVLWTLDVHVLASRLAPDDWRGLTDLAIGKRVAAIVARALDQARHTWLTDVPATAIADLAAAPPEPSAAYLAPGRRWHHELADNVAHLPTWRSRLKLLREIAFPSAAYMSRAYGVEGAAAHVFLPALYMVRLARGARKILTGRK